MRFFTQLLLMLLGASVLVLAMANPNGDDKHDDKHHGKHDDKHCDDDGHHEDKNDKGHRKDCPEPGKTSAGTTPVQGTMHPGKLYPPSPFVPAPDDESEDEPEVLPNPSGAMTPSTPAVNFTIAKPLGSRTDNALFPRQSACGGAQAVLSSSTTANSDTDTGIGGSAAEPNGASHANVVFVTTNWKVAISVDYGKTFNSLDPTTYSGPATPGVDGGFCCDQVVHYFPTIGRFVWLMQYQQDNSTGTPRTSKLRLITFRPEDVVSTGLTSWLYTDLVGSVLGPNGLLDFGELAVGDTQLFLSINWYGKAADGSNNSGFFVYRIPIAALGVVGTYTYRYTDPIYGVVAEGSRLAQHPGNAAFWAGHVPTTSGPQKMRVFRWLENSDSFGWNDLNVNPWPQNTTGFVSTCPSDGANAGINWLFINSANNIIGATRFESNQVWFGWNANLGGAFPHPHIQIAQVDISAFPTISLIKQWQIWNPDFAFAFPNFFPSIECGDIGIAVIYGGNDENPASAVGVVGNNGVLGGSLVAPEVSGTCEFRIGDYLGVRSDNGVEFEGFTYAIQPNEGGAVSRNARFSRFGRG